MKILFWLNTFLPDLGGIQTFTADLLPHLRGQGHEIILIADHGESKRPPFALHGDVPVHCFDTIGPLFRQNPAGIIRTRIAIQKLINEFQPDLIHLHPCGPEILYYLQITKTRPIPTVVTVHNNYETRNVRPTLDTGFGKMLAQAGQITTVSNEILDWILGYHPEFADKSQALLNGISPQTHPVKPLPWEPPTLLSLGRLAPQKQIDVLLKAFQIVNKSHPAACLKIVGDGPEADTLKTLAVQLEIDHVVDFPGRVHNSEVAELFNQATLFVMSSQHEGLPIAALEASQMARPIVSTRVGGMDQVVLSGETGLLVEAGDVVGLAASINTLLQNKEMAETFGHAAQDRVKNHFGMAKCAAKYNEVYKRLVTPVGECADV